MDRCVENGKKKKKWTKSRNQSYSYFLSIRFERMIYDSDNAWDVRSFLASHSLQQFFLSAAGICWRVREVTPLSYLINLHRMWQKGVIRLKSDCCTGQTRLPTTLWRGEGRTSLMVCLNMAPDSHVKIDFTGVVHFSDELNRVGETA